MQRPLYLKHRVIVHVLTVLLIPSTLVVNPIDRDIFNIKIQLSLSSCTSFLPVRTNYQGQRYGNDREKYIFLLKK